MERHMKVFVVGAGQMGGGIAQVMAAAGNPTYLYDLNLEIVKKRLFFIESWLTKSVGKGKLSEDEKTRTLNNIRPTADMNDAADCDIVVEAVIENLDTKINVFRQLDEITKPVCILATNTSSLSITKIASYTNRPEKVIGMHFMNPVPLMKLVEVIRGNATNDETVKAVWELALSLKKFPVEVRDVPGFVSNRVLQVMINEAIFCLYEDVASVEGIDTVMKLGMNHPMGPLQLADLIGLDTVLYILEVLYHGYGDPKYRPCPLLNQYVEKGWLGKKSGRGFYEYP
jgi:3-hydroxybutyryl-CoA dehydrogenase